MIAIIDYGAGNIFSVKNALDYLGFENKLTDKKEDIEKADAIILPGVGAFPWAMNMLGLSGLIDTIKEQAKIKPFLGICLGMQLLFEKSYDCPLFDGLGDDEYVYFVHSYKAFCDNKNLYAYCEYGSKVPAVVSDGRYIFGCQFHPEKSGKTGLKILENFAKMSQEVK